ncbi:cobalt ABC transporter, inner membrane subunit CbiQ [Methanocaldococcus sp. FS406-22]|uniref:cobalt ECF transporter T component CbiQ n=1 Tax=Methanocaldococcus sp. (strain FS406-22) TaxID=644281 RepID=UPI0001BF577B|nr:cobalt ECF transporter T component CbiQ [Methanocaldococcus sp. FS406-22]ADC69402.1 cobalt ABC transporter, inner membrane subunit CbiQ [Methanocaldococcus sp. FS406-22]
MNNKLFDKTIEHVIKYLNESIFFEKYTRTPGFLQNIESRVKIIALVVFLIGSVLSKHISTLIIFNFIALLLAYLSNIPITLYLKRVYIFIPIFAGIIVIPVMFNIVTPGKDIFVILNTPHISITYEGILYAITFTLRVATCVSFAVLIPITTQWNKVTSAIHKLGVPEVVITITNLAYRYIFLLLNFVLDMMYSRKSRVINKLGMVESWKEAGKAIGALFIKTYEMGEDTYYAMLSRGYSGEIKHIYREEIKMKDIIFLLFSIITTALLVLFDRGIL